jgi:glycosyltransferase involved in cell wall biosynthesis
MTTSRLKIFTWHIHGSYLYYLSQGNYDIYVPFNKERSDGFIGRGSFPFGDNVHEVSAEEVRQLEFDCILFQSAKNYLTDQHELFSAEQHTLPKIYLEHDPPRQVPTETIHIVDDPDITLVHVTHFNNLMWNNNRTPTAVIDHGVIVPHDVHYKGDIEKGIVVINNIAKRGRRLGLDVFLEVQKQIPLVLVGMGSKEVGGYGEIPIADLPDFVSRHRFFFNPIRYTSLGLAVCEAMMIGMPIVGMATTEMPTVITNGVSGFIHTDVNDLIGKMKVLLADHALARTLGDGAKQKAMERFNIQRFSSDWERLFQSVVSKTGSKKFSMV